ncbi:peptidyl-tRNA hydrolase PTH2-domain-containing protein [Lactarius vividus]|nr:peptidyl-tRNA hydrolase PTH2-domain-containing protein [Lactarius vividus]
MEKQSLYALAVTISVASATVGFLYGSAQRERKCRGQVEPPPPPAVPNPKQRDGHDSSDDEDAADGDLSTVSPGFLQPCKLVLVVRTDLKMSPGKIAAQCGHATLACYKALVKKNPKVSMLVRHWEVTGQAKIALKASSEEEILELEAIAKSLNLCARSIQDAGRTQVEAGSRTVLGIGPAPVELVNQVTGHLRLL